jgi:predicted 2-oxoglutarate/Fe(II)-dependent dioxygenase YbiX
VGAASHFRFYRYRPGQYFKPHRDGAYQDGQKESLVTALFYLNDADGGETVLMPYGLRQAWAHRPILPRAGDALLFEHRVWHEGRPVNSGEKYVLRTDLFYSE